MDPAPPVYAALEALGIPYERHEHPAVFHAGDASKFWDPIRGVQCKNLFLRNKKGDRHYLVVLEISKRADLKEIVKLVGDDRLSFGSAERLMAELHPDLMFVESGGDNLAAQFSRELVDYTIYVIDVAGGDKVPRKGGPGITQSDLLVINKTDLAPLVHADLSVMDRDACTMRSGGPVVFAQAAHDIAVDDVVDHILHTLQTSRSSGASPR